MPADFKHDCAENQHIPLNRLTHVDSMKFIFAVSYLKQATYILA
jgi:hypothetical protein